jgi:hypothetical protein
MKYSRFLASAVLAASAGCAGGSDSLAVLGRESVPVASFALARPLPNAIGGLVPPGMAPAGRRVIHPFVNSAAIARATNLIAVADTVDQVISAFDPSGNLLALLSGLQLPQGLASDMKGDLFVADASGSRVQVYAAGFTSPPRTLPDPGQFPVGVDSYGNGEFVAVANQFTTSYGPGSVTIYKDGKPGPPITDPAISQAYFDAFDANGSTCIRRITTTTTWCSTTRIRQAAPPFRRLKAKAHTRSGSPSFRRNIRAADEPADGAYSLKRKLSDADEIAASAMPLWTSGAAHCGSCANIAGATTGISRPDADGDDERIVAVLQLGLS